MLEAIGLVLFGVGAWFVADSLRAREQAHDSGKTACERNRLLFLDDTVELVSLRLARDEDGRLRLRRTYAFEFSDPLLNSGDNRRAGQVTLFRAGVESLTLEPFRLQ